MNVLKVKIELIESVHIPFTNLSLPPDTVIEGYYDGIGLTFYNNNVCYQISLLDVKYKMEIVGKR